MVDRPMEAPLSRYLRIVQGGGKLELLVLRSQVLVEEQLDGLISARLRNPKALKPLRLTAAQKILLVKGLYDRPGRAWLWESMTILNGLRNSLAHYVETHKNSKSDRKMDRLDALIGRHSGVPMPKKLAKPSVQRMQWRLASLFSVLAQLQAEARVD